MCGIIAAASERNVGKLLVQGLHKMEYRGYDSAGIALHQDDQIARIDRIDPIKQLAPSVRINQRYLIDLITLIDEIDLVVVTDLINQIGQVVQLVQLIKLL